MIRILSLLLAICILTQNVFAQATQSCTDNFAISIVDFDQNPTSSGGSVPLSASDANAALGVSDPANPANFVSLGVGGSIILEFTPPLANIPGNDVFVSETSDLVIDCAAHPDSAQIYASQDNISYSLIATICQDGEVDLGALPWAKYIKIVDVTDPLAAAFAGGVVDGYDLDAVRGANCLTGVKCPSAANGDPAYFGGSVHALYLPDLATDFIFVGSNKIYEEYSNGSAMLSGNVQSITNPNIQFFALLSLSEKTTMTPPMSPKLELNPSAYVPVGPVDPSTWHYYKSYSGILIGQGALVGTNIPYVSSMMLAFQVGNGANGKNLNYGGSGWIQYSSPFAGGAIVQGDWNIDLGSCTPTPTPTATVTLTPSPTETSTATNTATSTPTETATHTSTSTPTETPTNTATYTPTYTATETPTNTPTETPTNTPTETPTETPTNTPTDTPTETPTNTPSNTPTDTPINTATATNTAIVTNTVTPFVTFTPSPTFTAINVPDQVGNCVNTTTTQALVVLDSSLAAIKRNILDASRLLKRLGKGTTDVTFAAKSISSATSLQGNGWSIIWSLPQEIKTCTNFQGIQSICTLNDLSVPINQIKKISAELNKLSTNILKRAAKYAETPRVKKRLKKISTGIKDAEAAFAKFLVQVPDTNVTCSN